MRDKRYPFGEEKLKGILVSKPWSSNTWCVFINYQVGDHCEWGQRWTSLVGNLIAQQSIFMKLFKFFENNANVTMNFLCYINMDMTFRLLCNISTSQLFIQLHNLWLEWVQISITLYGSRVFNLQYFKVNIIDFFLTNLSVNGNSAEKIFYSSICWSK